jgi:hypothetical protein
MVVGGPDVHLRLDLMRVLSDRYDLSVAGSAPDLEIHFQRAGFEYHHYPLARGVDPVKDLRSLRHLEALFRKRRPLIVHTYATKPSVWGRIAARRAGVPVVVGTLPGLGSLYSPSGGEHPGGIAGGSTSGSSGMPATART